MAKQIAIILDKKGRMIEDISGTVSSGMLTFKRGGFMGFGGEENSIEFDLDKCVPSKKRYLVAYYEYDNGSISQLNFKQIKDRSVSAQYDLNYRLGHATIDNMIPALSDLNEKLKWLIIAVILILAIVVIFEANQLQNVSKNLTAQYAKQLDAATLMAQYAVNSCTQTYQIANGTLNYLGAINGKLKQPVP